MKHIEASSIWGVILSNSFQNRKRTSWKRGLVFCPLVPLCALVFLSAGVFLWWCFCGLALFLRSSHQKTSRNHRLFAHLTCKCASHHIVESLLSISPQTSAPTALLGGENYWNTAFRSVPIRHARAHAHLLWHLVNKSRTKRSCRSASFLQQVYPLRQVVGPQLPWFCTLAPGLQKRSPRVGILQILQEWVSLPLCTKNCQHPR